MISTEALKVGAGKGKQLSGDDIIGFQQLFQFFSLKKLTLFINQIAPIVADTDIIFLMVIFPEPIHSGKLTEMGIQ